MIPLRQISLLVGMFIFGFAYASLANVNVESPASTFIIPSRPSEVDSPHDWIKEEQIHVYDDKVIIEIADPEWARFTDTNSMDPVFDQGSNAIEVIPKKPGDIHVGDIVSYQSPYGIIIHRVVEIGEDEQGWFAIMKGDNNPYKDPHQVRFEQIQRLVVAVIY